MGERWLRLGPRIAAAFIAATGSWISFGVRPAAADGGPPPAYDISWPQCESGAPQGEFAFAIIGLNNGRPFTTNDCFAPQYAWAGQAQANPAVYINLDFPRGEQLAAANGPYGQCAADDGWCRGYNWGYALARDSVGRAIYFGVKPERYWLDVEMANHWSDLARDNGQVTRGAIDYFLEHNIPVGIYGTRYQWNLITGGYTPRGVTLPLWVAGAEDIAEAHARCHDRSLAFAGGDTWMVQYPEAEFDGNVLCGIAPQPKAPVAAPQPPVDQFIAPTSAATAERRTPDWPIKATGNTKLPHALHERIREALDGRLP